jgi:hypothetical protein
MMRRDSMSRRELVMADTNVIPFGAAIAGDVLSAFGLPGGNTLVAVAENYLAKKRKDAAEILIKEISSGRHGPVNFDQEDIEPLTEVILRFAKAVQEGAARENLILLAQVIAGLKKRRALDPDRFRRWCKIIEQLTRDELLVVGFAYQVEKEARQVGDKQANDFNNELRKKLQEAGYEGREVEALLMSVGSTGLLSSASAWGGLAYVPTPWLSDVAELADFEAQAQAKKT